MKAPIGLISETATFFQTCEETDNRKSVVTREPTIVYPGLLPGYYSNPGKYRQGREKP
jgi:hypothetical protein